MRIKVFGWVGVIWGAGIIVHSLLAPAPAGGAYRAGHSAGTVLGVLMLLAGACNVWCSSRTPPKG